MKKENFNFFFLKLCFVHKILSFVTKNHVICSFAQ